jgi:hypothetical protein
VSDLSFLFLFFAPVNTERLMGWSMLFVVAAAAGLEAAVWAAGRSAGGGGR